MKYRTKSEKRYRNSKLVAICLVAALAGCAEEDPQKFIQEGNTLLEKSDLDSARVQFKNALQINPKLAEAHYGIALLDEKKQDWRAMYAHLQETVSIDPSHLNALVKLGQMYLLQGDLDKAKELAEKARALSPDSNEVLIFQGALLFREGKNSEALQSIEKVLAKDSGNPDALVSFATILQSEKRSEEALVNLQHGIDAHPDNLGLGLLKIRILTELKRNAEVGQEFARLIQQKPDDKGLRNSHAELLFRLGETQAAEQALQEAVALFPDDVDIKLKLVAVIERRDSAEAETSLKQFVAERPQDLQLKARFAQFYAARGRNDDEKSVLDEIVLADPSGKEGSNAKIRLAEMAWGKGDKATAEKLVAEVLTVDKTQNNALLMRAGLRLDAKDIDGTISDLRIVLKDQPNSDRGMVMMAQAYVLKGEPEVAESHWRKALEVNPANINALLPVVGQYLKRNDPMRAQEFVDKALKADPANPAILEVLLQVKAAKKDWAGADAAIAELKKFPQSHLAVEFWSGLLAGERGDSDTAVKHFKTVLEEQPGANRAWEALAGTYRSSGKLRDLTGYLENYIQSKPDALQAYSLLASVYADQKQWDQAEKTLKQMVQKAPTVLDFKLRLLNLVERRAPAEAEAMLKQYAAENPQDLQLKTRLAAYYNAHKRPDEANEVFKAIVAADASGTAGQNARLQLAQNALRRGDVAGMSEYVEQVLSVNPDNADALLLRAGRRLDEKQVDEAIADLQHLLQVRPDADRAALLLAQGYLQKGDKPAAETQWRKILDANPASLSALMPLVAEMRQRGENGLAETLVEKANKANPGIPQIAELLVQMRVAKKDWSGAQSVVDQLKKQPQALVSAEMLQGMLAMARGQHTDAIKAFKAVLAEQPKAEQAISGLYQASLAAGQKDDLLAFMKAFNQKQPDVIAASNALGMLYSAESRWSEAEKVLKDTLQRQPGSLTTLNTLAGVLQKQGKSAEAESLYKDAVAQAPENVDLQMSLAKFYEQNNKAEQAISIYQGIIAKYPGNDEVANNLADMLVNYLDDAGSIQQAKTLVERFKDSGNPYFLDTYGWVMLKAGQLEPALTALKKSAENAPNLAPIRYHLAEAYLQASNEKSALQELKKSIELADQQGDFRGLDKAKLLLKQLEG